jgi:hypothetical protein
MATMIKYTENGAHFYDRNGTPRYDANIATARKENLLISPTTYLKILDKPQITNWKIDQYLQSAHEIMSQFPTTSLDDVKAYSKKNFDERNNQAEIGSLCHAVLEEAVKNAIPMKAWDPFFMDVADKQIVPIKKSMDLAWDWFTKNAINAQAESVVVSERYRYAGKKDVGAHILSPWESKVYLQATLDWKTQGVKHPGYQKRDPTKLYAVKFNEYKEWVIQIAAYSATTADRMGVVGVIGTKPEFPFFRPIYYNQERLVQGFKVFRCLQILYGLIQDIEIP